ncbi:hypothetical protein C8034_v006970 [Colletotrichum sidae]|uniref:Uncharacterized protein n=1 Tax=Colletotrichum sidae TaxID=1347389 RepID=A0A4R8T4I8_9PEZI|nr:hypothetical protein C8034_v006970 [Colletotrichum sidae]
MHFASLLVLAVGAATAAGAILPYKKGRVVARDEYKPAVCAVKCSGSCELGLNESCKTCYVDCMATANPSTDFEPFSAQEEDLVTV